MGAAQALRTPQSVRAQEAFHDWSSEPPAKRPLRAHRPAIAKVLFDLLKAHGVTKTRFAQMLGIDKKQVKKMLACDAPIPIDVAFALPTEMGIDFLQRLAAELGGGAAMGGTLVRLGMKRLRTEDRKATLADVLALAQELAR